MKTEEVEQAFLPTLKKPFGQTGVSAPPFTFPVAVSDLAGARRRGETQIAGIAP